MNLEHCAAEHPDRPDLTCIRLPGHDHEHAAAGGITWSIEPTVTEDGDLETVVVTTDTLEAYEAAVAPVAATDGWYSCGRSDGALRAVRALLADYEARTQGPPPWPRASLVLYAARVIVDEALDV